MTKYIVTVEVGGNGYIGLESSFGKACQVVLDKVNLWQKQEFISFAKLNSCSVEGVRYAIYVCHEDGEAELCVGM